MALGYQVESLEGIDENLQSLYVENDGKYVLDVEGVIPTSEYDAKILEANGKLKEVRKKADEYMNKLKGYGETTPETIEEMNHKIKELEALAENGKGATSEEVQQKIDTIRETFEGKLSSKEKEYIEKEMSYKNQVTELQGIIRDKELDGLVLDEIKDVCKSEMLSDAMTLIKLNMKYDEDLQKWESKDGLTIKEFAEKFFKERAPMVKESGGGGSKGNLNAGAINNPFKEGEHYNRTKQAEMFKNNPELARKLQKQALMAQK